MGGGSSRRWYRIFKPDPRSEINDELEFHFEERVRDYIARGMEPEAARAAAQRRLGELDTVRNECTDLLTQEHRSEARRDWLKMSWLDFKLGFRMLAKYPGITIVGGLAMAFAIAVGTLAFEFGAQLIYPSLPLPDGDRVVSIRLRDLASREVEEHAVYDFVTWREQLGSVEELGAYRRVGHNLITSANHTAPIGVAETTASAFSITRVKPLLGRTLLPEDERVDAPAVIVIGERLWRLAFASDPGVIGQTVRLSGKPSTVVGVMPESFGFPVNQGAWMPLRVDALNKAPREGTTIHVFGRLAAGVSLEDARAELSVLSRRASVRNPQTHERLRAEIVSYPHSYIPVSWGTLALFTAGGQAFVVLFLVLISANIATLVFARTAMRENEIVVRSALGASRSRILTQLLAETLVLGAFAAVVGVSVAQYALRTTLGLMLDTGPGVPFWLRDTLSPTTVLYAVVLTFLAAAVAGVVPGLKVTRGLAGGLRAAATGADLRFGGVWTALIIVQVALTVVFMALTLDVRLDGERARSLSVGFPSDQYIAPHVEMHRETSSNERAEVPFSAEERARFPLVFQELKRRIKADPAVVAVTYGTLPGSYHERRHVDAPGAAAPSGSGSGHVAQIAFVEPDFFDAFGIELLAGRGFHSGDISTATPPCTGCEVDSRAVIVNKNLAHQLFGDANPIGRHIRYLDARAVESTGSQAEWHEIVGVVENEAMTGDPDLLKDNLGGLYHVWAPGHTYSAQMAVQVRGTPEKFAPTLTRIAAEVDPGILISRNTLNALHTEVWRGYVMWLRVALAVSGIVLLLSVAGIWSIMSFTVSKRTREIGIRAALGGDPRRIVLAIFSRALAQVAAGVAIGVVIITIVNNGIGSGVYLYVPAGVMLAVTAMACAGPARRALRIEPTFALKADG